MKQLLLRAMVLWLGAAGPAAAQYYYGGAYPPDSLNRRLVLKVTPLMLFDPDNTLQAGLEVPLRNPRYSFQQEVGYGHAAYALYPTERAEQNKETWRLRTQLRRYYRQNQNGAGYFALEYLFKKNSLRQWRAVGRDCASPGQCAYFENRQVALGRFVNAWHLKMGWQYLLGDRLNLDLYWGVGVRDLTVRTLSLENEELTRDGDFLWFRTNRPGYYGPVPSLSLGFHLGWFLGPKYPPNRGQ
jgi:hypothetical protein